MTDFDILFVIAFCVSLITNVFLFRAAFLHIRAINMWRDTTDIWRNECYKHERRANLIIDYIDNNGYNLLKQKITIMLERHNSNDTMH